MTLESIELSKQTINGIEYSIANSINKLETNGVFVDNKLFLQLNVVQMIKHCYENLSFFTDTEINNISNISLNI